MLDLKVTKIQRKWFFCCLAGHTGQEYQAFNNVYRTCKEDKTSPSGGTWQDPDVSNCQNEDFDSLYDRVCEIYLNIMPVAGLLLLLCKDLLLFVSSLMLHCKINFLILRSTESFYISKRLCYKI